ncbi:MAG: ABC transporter ATP-binding protein [Selenomonadaceae bacterium]|nr:ABC transporter ATP-binding protein [Selenomonadaceae bacterium]
MNVEAKHISYYAGKKPILTDISVKFETGRITAILGPNGAGKSTLLRGIANLIDYKGDIFIDNTDIKDIKRKVFAQKVGFLPQHLEAPKDLTVEELAFYGRHPYRSFFGGEDEKTAKKAVEFALHSAKVFHLRNRRLKDLSGGERQRANLAMTLSGTPALLLLDEPTTYLDISHQLEVMEIVKELNFKNNITVIMVLHDLNHAIRYADSAVIIKSGEIYKTGKPAEILTKETILKVFGVDSEIVKTAGGESVIVAKKPIFGK